MNCVQKECAPGTTSIDKHRLKVCNGNGEWFNPFDSKHSKPSEVKDIASCPADGEMAVRKIDNLKISIGKANPDIKPRNSKKDSGSHSYLRSLLHAGSHYLSDKSITKSFMMGMAAGNCGAARQCQGTQQAQAQSCGAKQQQCGQQAKTCANSANQMKQAAQSQAKQTNTAQKQNVQKSQANVSAASKTESKIANSTSMSAASKQQSMQQAQENKKIAEMNQSMSQKTQQTSEENSKQLVAQAEQNVKTAEENKSTEKEQAASFELIRKREAEQANANVEKADLNKEAEDKASITNEVISAVKPSVNSTVSSSTSTSASSSAASGGILVNLDNLGFGQDKTYDRVFRVNDQDLVLSEQRLATGEVANTPDDLLYDTTIKEILPTQKLYRSNYSILKRQSPNVVLVKEPIAFKSFEDMKDYILSRQELLSRPVYPLLEKYKEFKPERKQYVITDTE